MAACQGLAEKEFGSDECKRANILLADRYYVQLSLYKRVEHMDRKHLLESDLVRRRSGFTLVELLVVIGIMGVLISLLLPSITSAMKASKGIKCEAQLHDISLALLNYADEHEGFLFPSDMGADAAHFNEDPTVGPIFHETWPLRVFGKWNPPEMICPADLDPALQHSYVLNSHMGYWNVKYSTQLPGHKSASDVVLMGEKVTTIQDYYMEYGDFERVVEPYRHGTKWGSNYLFLDLHVDTVLPNVAEAALDPWDFAA